MAEDDLKEIARSGANLERESGVLARITIGHTLHAEPQNRQPELVGFLRHQRFGTFGPSSEPAVLADLYIRPDRVSDVRDYPYRSAEYYHASKRISGLALLRTDPALDLGVVSYCSPDRPDHYLMEGKVMNGAPAPATPAAAQGPANAAPPAQATYNEEDVKALLGMIRKMFGLPEGWPGDAEAKPEDKKPEDKKPEDKASEEYAKKHMPELYALRVQVAQMQSQHAAEMDARHRSEAAMMVQQMISEGYSLSAEEITEEQNELYSRRADVAVQAKYLEKIRKLYATGGRKIPGALPFQFQPYQLTLPAPSTATKGPGDAPEYHERAMAYMYSRPGCSYEQAVIEVTKK